MGRLERERLADEERLGVRQFRVRQWTNFAPTGVDQRDRRDHLERAAKIVERRLCDRYPDQRAKVKQVTVGDEPQLLFEITLPALGETDAKRRAVYRFDRALASKILVGMSRKATVRPQWGDAEVTRRPGMAIV